MTTANTDAKYQWHYYVTHTPYLGADRIKELSERKGGGVPRKKEDYAVFLVVALELPTPAEVRDLGALPTVIFGPKAYPAVSPEDAAAQAGVDMGKLDHPPKGKIKVRVMEMHRMHKEDTEE